MIRLGKQQLTMLLMLASPGRLLIVPDRVARSLIRRGLCADPYGDCVGCCITPDGMRVLADYYEAGKLGDFWDIRRRARADDELGRWADDGGAQA